MVILPRNNRIAGRKISFSITIKCLPAVQPGSSVIPGKIKSMHIPDTHTKFIYEGQNKGVNFVGRAMLKLGSDKSNNKVVQEFMQKVEQEALKA